MQEVDVLIYIFLPCGVLKNLVRPVAAASLLGKCISSPDLASYVMCVDGDSQWLARPGRILFDATASMHFRLELLKTQLFSSLTRRRQSDDDRPSS